MPGQPVGHRVEQRRAAPRLQEFAFGGHRGGHRQRVVAVHPFGVQPLGVDPGADPRQHLEAHGLACGLAAHAVEVVEEVEQHRRGTAKLRIPQGPILLHGGEGDRFPGRPAAGRGVADIGDHDSGPAVAALEQRRAGGDGSRAADDGVVGHASERREEGVHGAAEPAVQAGGTREDFRQHAVEDEVTRQFPHRIPLRRGFDDAQHGAFKIGFHDALQLRFRQRTDRARALGEDLAVAAVRPEDQILRRQRQTQAHHRRFLADRQVGGARMLIFDAAERALRLDVAEHALEGADRHHVGVDLAQRFGPPAFPLRHRVRAVLIQRNRRGFQPPRPPHLLRRHHHRLRHRPTTPPSTGSGLSISTGMLQDRFMVLLDDDPHLQVYP